MASRSRTSQNSWPSRSRGRDGVGSRTRRGLALTVYSEFLLLVGLATFAISPTQLPVLVLAILGSLVPGLPGGLAMWRGRKEFGPAHAKAVFWGGASFSLLGLCLIIVAVMLSSMRGSGFYARDLAVPASLLGATIVADAGAMAGLTGRVLIGSQRRWLGALAAVTGAVTVWYAWYARSFLGEVTYRTSGVRLDSVEGPSYLMDFQLGVARTWVLALLALRVAFWPALYAALSNVSEAEAEAQGEESSRGAEDLG